ncbi:MAG TPA: hypothetical protein VHK86_00205 [Nitrososphaera sp.]|jgi:hypothetical protein|nr:hypothetical protein [Nitrososphaera sp.]
MWRDQYGWSVGRITVTAETLGGGSVRESLFENLEFDDALSCVCMLNGADVPTEDFGKLLKRKANHEGMKKL